jgi:hypothetical protein
MKFTAPKDQGGIFNFISKSAVYKLRTLGYLMPILGWECGGFQSPNGARCDSPVQRTGFDAQK